MKKLKIAILDNGVDEKIFKLCGLSNIIRQNKGSVSNDMNLFVLMQDYTVINFLTMLEKEM